MKYTFDYNGKEKTVTIPDDYIQKNKRSLGVSTTEAIHLWLYDNGYESNAEADALNEQAKGVKVRNSGASVRKKPSRKPDIVKRAIVTELHRYFDKEIIEMLNEKDVPQEIKNVEIINPERTISFTLGEDTYEVILSKKRKPKNQ